MAREDLATPYQLLGLFYVASTVSAIVNEHYQISKRCVSSHLPLVGKD